MFFTRISVSPRGIPICLWCITLWVCVCVLLLSSASKNFHYFSFSHSLISIYMARNMLDISVPLSLSLSIVLSLSLSPSLCPSFSGPQEIVLTHPEIFVCMKVIKALWLLHFRNANSNSGAKAWQTPIDCAHSSHAHRHAHTFINGLCDWRGKEARVIVSYVLWCVFMWIVIVSSFAQQQQHL